MKKHGKPKQILVITDALYNAQLVKDLLSQEFSQVAISTCAKLSIQDFKEQAPQVLAQEIEKYRPQVLVLAIEELASAQHIYLELFRSSSLLHTLAHRTIVLCDNKGLQHAYELCSNEYFDDYVLFWPMNHDAPRLCMAVHNALRQLSDTPNSAQFAAQVRRIAELEALLEQSVERGREYITAANDSLVRVQDNATAERQDFFQQLANGAHPEWLEIRDRAAFLREVENMQAAQTKQHDEARAAALRPVRDWANAIHSELTPQLDGVRELQALAEHIPPLILAVDDDRFQHRLLQQIFSDTNIDLICVASGAEALASLRRQRPDLVMMDIQLPGIDGVEVTRRLKAVEQFKSIPIIMITGQSDKAVVINSLKAGAAGFLVKPFDRQTMLPRIRSLLNSPESES